MTSESYDAPMMVIKTGLPLDYVIHRLLERPGDPLPYSTDPGAALDALQAAYAGAYLLSLTRNPIGDVGMTSWTARAAWLSDMEATAPTLPLAVCMLLINGLADQRQVEAWLTEAGSAWDMESATDLPAPEDADLPPLDY